MLSFSSRPGATDDQLGFDLARQLRARFPLLGPGPVANLQTFIETCLQIPVVSVALDERLASIVVSTGAGAGIVINERGDNRHVWTRRLSLARALGYVMLGAHRPGAGMIFETHARLEDDYAVAGSKGCQARQVGAFAMDFLAPAAGVREIVGGTNDSATVIGMIMMVYGVTARAAVRHVKAVTHRNVPNFPVSDVPWAMTAARDGAAGTPVGTPLARTGQFALLTAKAHRDGLLSLDSVLAYLQCSEGALRDYLRLAEMPVT